MKANTIGRPIKSVSMHLHVEFFIMEAVLKHPEKTLQNLQCKQQRWQWQQQRRKMIGLMSKNNRPGCAF